MPPADTLALDPDHALHAAQLRALRVLRRDRMPAAEIRDVLGWSPATYYRRLADLRRTDRYRLTGRPLGRESA